MRNITEYHLSQRRYSDPDGYLSSLREEEWREETLLPEFEFFPSPFLPFCQNSFSHYGEKNVIGIGCMDGIFLIICKGSSYLFFSSMKCSLRDPPITISSSMVSKTKIEWKGFWLLDSYFVSPRSLEIILLFYLK